MKLTRWPNTALHTALAQKPTSVGTVQPDFLQTIFREYTAYDTVWAHVGLSDVNAALPGNPYTSVMDALTAHFESVLTTGFTHYFKTSGVYDKQHSQPHHGMFTKLFLADATYRTDDAIKSILVNGPYRFDGCNHRDTYASDGCFQQLRDDDILVVSIGTPWLICSYLHHIEARYDVPYMEHRDFEGVMYDDGSLSEIVQRNHSYDGIWRFNKLKIHYRLRRENKLDEYHQNGLSVFVFPLSWIDDVLSPRVAADPYYLVT